MIIETEKFHDPPPVNWRLKKAKGISSVQVQKTHFS